MAGAQLRRGLGGRLARVWLMGVCGLRPGASQGEARSAALISGAVRRVLPRVVVDWPGVGRGVRQGWGVGWRIASCASRRAKGGERAWRGISRFGDCGALWRVARASGLGRP